jgi:hypothetical protein
MSTAQALALAHGIEFNALVGPEIRTVFIIDASGLKLVFTQV